MFFLSLLASGTIFSAPSMDKNQHYDFKTAGANDIFKNIQATEDEKKLKIIENFKDSLHQRGAWLNSPLPGQSDTDAVLAADDIMKILVEFTEKKPALGEIPIRVFIYESTTPNAWVSRFNGSSKLFSGINIKEVNKALGYDPDIGFIELGITTALLKSIPKTRDALAFIIGHESGHIVEKHLKDGSKIKYQDLAKGWVDRHINEFAADESGIDFMKGLFNLDEAISALKSLFELQAGSNRQKLAPHEIEKLVIKALNSVTSTHPHEGIRLALAEASVRYKKRKLTLETPSTPLPEFYRRLGQKEKPSLAVPLNNSAIKSLEQAFEGNPKEITENFERHTLAVSLSLGTSLLDQFIQKLESLSSSEFLKSYAFLRTMVHSMSFEYTEKEFFKISEGSTLQLETWLRALTPQQLDQLTDLLIKNEFGHIILLSISNIPKSMQSPEKWSALEKLALSFFQKTIDSFILIESDPDFKDHMLNEAFRKTSNSRLRHAIMQIAINSIRTINEDNISDRTIQASSQRILKHSNRTNMFSQTSVYEAINKFLSLAATMPEAPSLKLSIASATQSIQGSLERSIFKNFTFPAPHQIRIEFIKNPAYDGAMKMGYDADNLIPNTRRSPFDQLERLNKLDSRHFSRHSADVQRFLGDILFSALKPPSEFNTIKYLISNSYTIKYDSLIADEIIQRLGTIDHMSMLQVLAAWTEIRRRIGHEPLKIQPRQRDEIAHLLKDLPKDVLYKSSLSSLGIYEDVGLLDSFWDTLSLNEVLTYLKRIGDGSPPNRVIDSMLNSLTRKNVSTTSEALLWIEILEKALTMHYSTYTISSDIENKIHDASESVLRHLSHNTKLSKLKIAKLRSMLYKKSVITTLRLEAHRRFAKDGRDTKKLPDLLKTFEKELNIEPSDTLVSAYRNTLAQSLKIQPHNRDLIDPTEGQSLTEMGNGHFSKLVRGFSGLLEIVRELPASEQISFIRFISGKTTRIPSFVNQIDENENIKAGLNFTLRSFESWILELKQRMTESDPLSRALIIHSFLTGPTGLMNDHDGQKQLERTLLNDLPVNTQKSVNLIIAALKVAEGREFGLLLSYALAQQGIEKDGVKQAPVGANLLKAFLESYGVPGTKFGQFMAFSSRFKEFRSAFESFQDSALPLSYIGMLKLLEKSMGVPWNASRFEVVEIKGSGSVNVAITVNDLLLGSQKILNVLREDIEVEAKNDFKRFQKFVTAVNTVSAGTDLAFIGGVAHLVEDSVQSEFDKPRAKRMHDYSESQYAHRVGDWTVRSVHVDEVLGRSLVMDVASGISARKVLNANPGVYNQAMKALLSIAVQRIQGIGPDSKPTDKPIISDPDIHNGQFFINEATKTITLLDKGQSSTPTTTERELAKTLFQIASHIITGNAIYTHLKPFESNLGVTLNTTHIDRILQLQKLETPIDRYLNSVGYLREIGKVPTATVNWGFEFYRLTELASQVDRHQELEIKSVLLKGIIGTATRTALNIYGTKIKKNSVPVSLSSPNLCSRFYGGH